MATSGREFCSGSPLNMLPESMSWVNSGELKWIHQEWLYAMVSWKIWEFSPKILLSIHFSSIPLLILLWFRYGVIKSDGFLSPILIYAIMVSIWPMNFRAFMLDGFFMVILLFILRKSSESRDSMKFLYLLPLLSIIWCNTHMGSCIMLFMTYIIYIACVAFGWESSWGRSQHSCVLSLFLVFSFLSCFMNPYGYQWLTYPLTNMSDSFMLNFVSEWHSPDFKDIWTIFMTGVPTSASLISMCKSKNSNGKCFDAILYTFILMMFIRSSRFSFFLGLLNVSMLAKYSVFECDSKMDVKWYKKVVTVIMLIFIPLYAVVGSTMEFDDDGNVSDEILSELSCMKVEKGDETFRIYNDYNIGGYLAYNGIPPIISQAYHPYQKSDFFESFKTLTYTRFGENEINSMESLQKVWKIAEMWNFDALLLSRYNITLNEWCELNGYKRISEDENYILWRK